MDDSAADAIFWQDAGILSVQLTMHFGCSLAVDCTQCVQHIGCTLVIVVHYWIG